MSILHLLSCLKSKPPKEEVGLPLGLDFISLILNIFSSLKMASQAFYLKTLLVAEIVNSKLEYSV